MPWSYSQLSGNLYHDGKFAGVGYSGLHEGKNTPDKQDVHDIGPIPRGTYAIQAPFHHPHAGGYTLRLQPSIGTITFGRAGLMIHSDSTAHPGEASSGCIILPIATRKKIWESGDHTIKVVH